MQSLLKNKEKKGEHEKKYKTFIGADYLFRQSGI
jgi:hypothetical protein